MVGAAGDADEEGHALRFNGPATAEAFKYFQPILRGRGPEFQISEVPKVAANGRNVLRALAELQVRQPDERGDLVTEGRFVGRRLTPERCAGLLNVHVFSIAAAASHVGWSKFNLEEDQTFYLIFDPLSLSKLTDEAIETGLDELGEIDQTAINFLASFSCAIGAELMKISTRNRAGIINLSAMLHRVSVLLHRHERIDPERFGAALKEWAVEMKIGPI